MSEELERELMLSALIDAEMDARGSRLLKGAKTKDGL